MKQKMTKLFCLLAAFTLTISMTACGNPGSESQTDRSSWPWDAICAVCAGF